MYLSPNFRRVGERATTVTTTPRSASLPAATSTGRERIVPSPCPTVTYELVLRLLRAEIDSPNLSRKVDDVSDALISLIAREDIPELGIEAGDVIRWNRGTTSAHPFTVHRRRSFDFGALLVAMNESRLEPIAVMRASDASPASEAAAEAVTQELRPLLRLHRRLG